MKRIIVVIFIFIGVLSSTLSVSAQCRDFNEPACMQSLSPYKNYGNYISTVMTDGMYAELNMTFYSKIDYRLVICGLENIPNLEFRVLDSNHNPLFKNKDHDFTRSWDFKLSDSQQLIIQIIIPETDEPQKGCVALMHGMKVKEE